MSGRRSRNKGKNAEREIAHILKRLFKVEARRGRQFKGTPDSPDVVHSIPELHIEVKRQEHMQLYKWMDKAEDDAGEDIPIIMHRKNEGQWLATINLEDLPALALILERVLSDKKD